MFALQLFLTFSLKGTEFVDQWLQAQRSRVRFPVLSDVFRSSGSETGLSLEMMNEELHEGKGSSHDLERET
jgi:hypothetical protein